MKDIVDKLVSIDFDEINNIELSLFEKTGIIINYKNCKYEFIIHLVDFDNNMVILGSSFLSPQAKIKFKDRPYFERQSWVKDIKHNVLFYNDPTLYDFEEANGGWGIGTPENWHLENISEIIKKLADKIFDYNEMTIPQYGNLFFYGGSMGGFMSIALSVLIKNSTSIADAPQFNLFNWWYWDSLKNVCFNGLSDEEIMQYSYKLDIIDLINMKKVIPNSYIILDCTDQRDWDTQIRYFLNKLDDLPYYYNSQDNNINLHFVGKCIKHNMLSKNETLNFIDEIIMLQNSKLHFNPIKSEMLIDFKKEVEKIYSLYDTNRIQFSEFNRLINNYLNKWEECRVDIKNIGNENNSIKLLGKDRNVSIEFPNWFSNEEGKGCVISSAKHLNLKIKCVNEGNLNIAFRGHDYRNYDQKRTPVHICYNNFKINNKLIFSKDFFQWHNRPYIFTQKCENNEIIDIKIKFETIGDYFPKLNELIYALNENEETLKKNYAALIDYINESLKESNPRYFQ